MIEQHAKRSTQIRTTVGICEKDIAKIHSFLPPMSKTEYSVAFLPVKIAASVANFVFANDV